MKKNKKQHLLLAVLLVVVIGVVCGGIRMVQSRKAAESEPAFSLTISGVPISEEEYVQCMKRVRYDTKMELKGQKKDITEDTVWTETYADGQTGRVTASATKRSYSPKLQKKKAIFRMQLLPE